MCSGLHDPDGEVRGGSVGCTIGVSDTSASRVLQPRNVPSGVSKAKKNAFSSGGVVRGAAKFGVFLIFMKTSTTVGKCPFMSRAVSLEEVRVSPVRRS